MSDSQKKIEEASDLPPPPSANDYIAAAPRISVQAFCERQRHRGGDANRPATTGGSPRPI